jgi:DNA topoisomerase-1
MTKLLIIESPGKQKTIQGYLGSDWTVVASFGHIRGIKESIDFIQNDFETTYEYNKEKSKAITAIKEAAKKATDIYLGSDKDLEGEQIAYSLCVLLRLNPSTAKRIIFTEITKKAITHAIEHAGHIDMNRVHAQQARAMLDMMIGFTISPILWRYVAANLSAGRCQTPALRLVIERENGIETFKGSSSWQLQATIQSPTLSFPSIMTDELDDEESAVNYMENVHQTTSMRVLSTQQKPWTESAPAPLITSTLQQQASAKFGLNPKSTMQLAQRLYEAGHITYMRTDQPVMSEDAKASAKEWVVAQYGEEYVSQQDAKKKTKKASADQTTVEPQEAHEAIRPTHMEVLEAGGDAYEQKIYQLIWQRAIQSVMSPVRGETYSATLQIDQDEFSWSSTWKRTTFEGWRKAGAVAQLDAESDEEAPSSTDWDRAIQIKEGDILEWTQMKAIPKETKAQGRYTEATLVRELESHGIGRPSTFASLLSAIQDRKYVESRDFPAKEVAIKEYQLQPSLWPPLSRTIKRKMGAEKNKLVPTPLGRSVWNYLSQTFADLFAYPFTATMEQRLDHIAKGEEPWKRVLQETWASYQDRYDTLYRSAPSTNPKIREFSGGVKAVQSKKGPLLLIEHSATVGGKTKADTTFLGWPTGISFEGITEDDITTFRASQVKEAQRLGEWNGEPIQKHDGKFGPYLRCGDLTIPYQDETLEETIARLTIKKSSGAIQTFKEYVIRTGQYGPYIMKTSLKKPQFVSLPKGLDPMNLTEKDVKALYQSGLEEKKKYGSKYKKPKE